MADAPQNVSSLGFEQSEPRCKICRSPHRREIDSMLVTGWSHAQLLRHWNSYLRTPAFSANNISVHASRHLNPHDPALQPIRQRCVALLLDQAREGDTLALPLADNIRLLLQLLEGFGVYAMRNNLVEVEVKDALRAITLRGQLDELAAAGREAAAQQHEDALRRELHLFLEAVKEVVSPADHRTIYERFRELLSDQGVVDTPA